MEPATILVVERDILVRQPLAQYLRDCGYRVLEAVNAAEARGAVSTGRESIDVVLMDVKGVPSEGGFTLASWLRSNHPTIKVLLGGTIAKVLQLAGYLCNDAPEGGLDYRSVLDHIRRLLAGRDQRSPDRRTTDSDVAFLVVARWPRQLADPTTRRPSATKAPIAITTASASKRAPPSSTPLTVDLSTRCVAAK
jgi:DNA-binding NtrC family response regulator